MIGTLFYNIKYLIYTHTYIYMCVCVNIIIHIITQLIKYKIIDIVNFGQPHKVLIPEN